MLKQLSFHHHMILDPSNFSNNSKHVRCRQFLPALQHLFIWTRGTLHAAGLDVILRSSARIPLCHSLMSVLSVWCLQGDIALRFICFAKGNGALQPPGAGWGGRRGCPEKPTAFWHRARVNIHTGSPVPRMQWYHWTGGFSSPAGPNTINHVSTQMQGFWPMDWQTNSEKTKRVGIWLFFLKRQLFQNHPAVMLLYDRTLAYSKT